MVQTKATPHHAEVRPPKCVVYITRNPVTFVIKRHHSLFLLDQQARDRECLEAYKRHVHKPPMESASANTTKNTAHSQGDKTPTIRGQRQ